MNSFPVKFNKTMLLFAILIIIVTGVKIFVSRQFNLWITSHIDFENIFSGPAFAECSYGGVVDKNQQVFGLITTQGSIYMIQSLG